MLVWWIRYRALTNTAFALQDKKILLCVKYMTNTQSLSRKTLLIIAKYHFKMTLNFILFISCASISHTQMYYQLTLQLYICCIHSYMCWPWILAILKELCWKGSYLHAFFNSFTSINTNKCMVHLLVLIYIKHFKITYTYIFSK